MTLYDSLDGAPVAGAPARGRAARTRPVMAGTRRPPTDFGPIQISNHLRLQRWQVQRAMDGGLLARPDPASGRWPAAVVEDALARREEIVAAVGTVPDVGARRAAEVLTERFGFDVAPGVLHELDRAGLVCRVGSYKDSPLYDGRALEAFADEAALRRCLDRGRLLTTVEVAGHLRVRRSDVDHLVRVRWLQPVTHVRSGWQRKRDNPLVALFRVGDLEVLLAHPGIDWDAVRSTPRGRRSPLAQLSPRRAPVTTRRGEGVWPGGS